MDDLERISKKLGTIDILKSQKEKVESMSNINPDECYHDLVSLLRRMGFYGGYIGNSYINKAYEASQKGKKALCTFIDELIFEITKIGLPDQLTKPTSGISINNTNHQSQQQNQKIVLEIFIESIKDELTGKQMKELIQIIKEEPDKDIAKNKIIDKLKDFGVGVLSGIVGNIITNPNIISCL